MRRLIAAIALLLVMTPSVSAGDLTTAGALSGAGQGLGNGLAIMQLGLMQQSLMTEQARLEQARLEYMMRQREATQQPMPRAIPSGINEQAVRDRLSQLQPDWQRITAQGGPYRQWLATQPASYQTLVNNTWDAEVAAASIDQFRGDHARSAQQLQGEKARLDQRRTAIDAMADSEVRRQILQGYMTDLEAYTTRLDAHYQLYGK